MTDARILVVEDEVIVARTIVNQLTQLGYTVTGTASSGLAAIAKAIETQPNLVLMDIVLKGELDGVETATRIRSHLNVPVIYLTAYADDTTLQRAKVTQPFGYIVKPFTSDDLRVGIEIGLLKYWLEQELRENRDQLATILRSMSDAVIATDAEERVTFMNPAAELITGWQQEEAAGKAVTEVLHLVNEVTDLPTEHPVALAMQAQQVVYLDAFTALVARDGSRVPIGDSASPLRKTDGTLSGAVVVFWNMSDRRQTELLAEALEKERQVNQLKSQFISTASHEFRNPLAVIRTAVALLELQFSTLTQEKHLSYLERIKNSVQVMNTLMEDVLIIGQAEEAKLSCNPAPLNVDQFCRDLIEEFLIAETRSHEILFRSQNTDGIEVCLDERLLRYILINLLTNAVKYSPGTAPILFEVNRELDQHQITFQIQDQGIGIPEADLAHLFEPFHRAANVQSIQGTGLGLTIVKRCVEAHEGQIQVNSMIGQGTTFTVILPLNTGILLPSAECH